jgi:diguanylate cyclase (GGDEF)-like protein
LDLNTILIIGLMLHSALTLAMLQTYLTRKTYPGFRNWTAGVGCWVLANAVVYFRDFVGNGTALLVGTPLLFLVGIFLHHGFIRFYDPENGRRRLVPDVAVACLGLCIVYWNYFAQQDSNVRVCANSLTAGFLLLRAVSETFRFPCARRSIIQFNISLSLGLMALFLIVRGVRVALGPSLPRMQFGDPMLGPVLVLGLVAVVIAVYGFISLMHARLEEELLDAQARLREQANTDALTGLLNRRGFDEIAGHDLRLATRYGHGMSLVMFDLDHFKIVNDTHGHAVGDEVLAAVGRLCMEATRDVDVVARVGGEEFVVLMPQTGLEDARQAAERLRRMLKRTWEVAGAEIVISASFGVAELDGGGLEAMMHCADSRLYKAKREGRDRVCASV